MRLPEGFRGGATRAGIKPSGRPDLAVLWSDGPCAAAGAFTKNRFAAAPVVLSRRRVASGRARAVLVNSGCANAATGPEGLAAAERTSAFLAARLGIPADEVLVASTGVIGVPLPAEKIEAGIERILAAPSDELEPLAEAILTTDTRPKVASRALPGGASLVGFAKGAGMIHPDLAVAPSATMLAFLLTDAAADAAALRAILARHLPPTLSAVTVDGDTSTNDTVFFLASGRKPAEGLDGAVAEVLAELAEGIAADGEGVTRVAEVVVEEAADEAEARRVAEVVATSLLVKTALAGGDPNWGRIAAAAGRSGVEVAPERTRIAIGDVVLFEGGRPAPHDPADARRAMSQRRVTIRIALGRGTASARYLTTDLTAEYVRINAEYTT